MADTIDPVTGKVVLNLITRTHVTRLVLQSLMTVLIRSNPQIAELIVQDLESRAASSRDPQLRDYFELAVGEVLDATAAVRAK